VVAKTFNIQEQDGKALCNALEEQRRTISGPDATERQAPWLLLERRHFGPAQLLRGTFFSVYVWLQLVLDR
jgi:hypothetical protein